MTRAELKLVAVQYFGHAEVPDFRTFYRRHIFSGGTESAWAGINGEMFGTVFNRLADAFADYTDFVVMVRTQPRMPPPPPPSDSGYVRKGG